MNNSKRSVGKARERLEWLNVRLASRRLIAFPEAQNFSRAACVGVRECQSATSLPRLPSPRSNAAPASRSEAAHLRHVALQQGYINGSMLPRG
jgi:hypothetical protein